MLITRAGHRLPNDLLVQAAFDVQRQPTLLFNGYADQWHAVSWPGFAGEFLNASDSKTGDMAESLLHLAGLLPFLWLVWAINHGGLGADPVKDIQHFTGRTALKFCLRPC